MRRSWLQRWSTERRVAVALRLLRGDEGHGDLTQGRRAELLSELAAELESCDPYTHGHSRRVARHAVIIAIRMGLGEHQVAVIRAAAALHDVGKINTPRAVLHKPGRLTEVELALIELHPVDGAEIVSTLGDAELTAMVRHHHERLDGTGYPAGLAGEAIPLGARIIAVADTFDAITSARPYRPAARHKKALDILTREAGTQLDPAAVDAFVRCYSGNRLFALWALLAAAPQRAFAAARRITGAPTATVAPTVAPTTGITVATTAATLAITAAAVIPPLGLLGHTRAGAAPRPAVQAALTRASSAAAPAASGSGTPVRHRKSAAGTRRVGRDFAVLSLGHGAAAASAGTAAGTGSVLVARTPVAGAPVSRAPSPSGREHAARPSGSSRRTASGTGSPLA